MDRAFDDLAEFDASFEVTGFHLYVHDDVDGWQPTRDFDAPLLGGAHCTAERRSAMTSVTPCGSPYAGRG